MVKQDIPKQYFFIYENYWRLIQQYHVKFTHNHKSKISIYIYKLCYYNLIKLILNFDYLWTKNNDKKIRIIFEIANNHQGSVDHFKKILDDIYVSTRKFLNEFEFLIKFQFRDIPTFC